MSIEPILCRDHRHSERSSYLYGPVVAPLPEQFKLFPCGVDARIKPRPLSELGEVRPTPTGPPRPRDRSQIGIVSVTYHANGEVGLMAVEAA